MIEREPCTEQEMARYAPVMERIERREAREKEALVEKGWGIVLSLDEDGNDGQLGGMGGPGDRYLVGPNGDGKIYLLMDLHSRRGLCCLAGFLPTPDQAAAILAEHGTPREEFLNPETVIPMVVPGGADS